MMARALEGQRAAVVGGSLGGLAAANVLFQLGAVVTVFEQHPKGFEQRGGGLGVSIPLFQDIRLTDREEVPRVLPGGGHFYCDAWQFLRAGLPENCVQYGITVKSIHNADSDHPELEIVKHVSNRSEKGKKDDDDDDDDASATVSRSAFDLVVLADGGWSELRKYILKPDENGEKGDSDRIERMHGQDRPEYAGYVLWRGLVKESKLPWIPSKTNGTMEYKKAEDADACAGRHLHYFYFVSISF